MAWEVEYNGEFEQWWDGLTAEQQKKVNTAVILLEQRGPNLDFPYSSGVKDSRHPHMRELRIQAQGKPLRVLYAFSPNRSAILLLGGDKTGDDRWYEVNVPVADRLYDQYLSELKNESPNGGWHG